MVAVMKLITLLSIMMVANAVQFLDCGSKDCKITSLDIANCAADAESCDFPSGSTANMTLKFTTNQDITTLTNSIEGEVGDIWVPFGTPINGCDTTNPKCPIASATAAVYTLSLPIKSEYPKINVPVKSEMKDNTGADCTCFIMQARIV